MQRARLELLGGFRFVLSEGKTSALDAPRLQSLFAYLALHRAAPQHRERIASALWPDKTGDRARANLRKFLLDLRKAVPDFNAFIQDEAQILQWRSDAPCDIDVFEFDQAMMDSDFARALDLYRGDLMPACDDEWIAPERERLAQSFVRSALRMMHLLEARREYAEAVALAERLIARDSFDESAHRAGMRLRALNGDRAGALHAFERCAALLRRELGIEPDPETRQLREAIAQARPLVMRDAGADEENKLVGRVAEWQRLMQAWEKAVPRAAYCVTIRGEAGIGKSRLAEELRAWASRQSISSAQARSYAAEGALAFAPVTDWLRAPDLYNHLDALDPRWLSEVSRLLPEASVLRPGVPAPLPIAEPWQRQQLFEALVRAMHAAGKALILVLDDIQWCDRETIEWLHFLLRFEGPARLLVVCTQRVEEISGDHPAVELERVLQREDRASIIDLGPLSAIDSAALAARVQGHSLNEAQVQRLYKETEGNPLFVVEAARSGLDADAEADALSPTVRAVIERRLSQLTPSAQDAARVAAVIGRAFDFDVLYRASSLDEFAALDAIEELARKRIVRETLAAGIYDFAHDRIRETAYASISDLRRRALHRRVAQALSDLHASDLDAFSSQIARHHELGGQTGEAIAFYLRAAREALRVYAIDECERLCNQVFSLEKGRHAMTVEACETRILLAEAFRLNGRWEEAEKHARDAEQRAQAARLALLAARAERTLADILRLQGLYNEALSWLVKAREGFEDAGDFAGLQQTLWTMGEVFWYLGRNDEALQVLEQQLTLARKQDDSRSAADALASMGMVHWSMGALERARACCDQAVALGEASGNWFAVSRASITEGNIDHSLSDAAASVAWYARAYSVATRINDLQADMWAVANMGGILGWMLDDVAVALAYQIRVFEIASVIGDRWTFCQILTDVGAFVTRLGRPDKGEHYMKVAVEIGRPLGMPTYLSGMLNELAIFLLERSRPQEADTALGESESLIAAVTGDRIAGSDERFNHAVLRIRVDFMLGRLRQDEAVSKMRQLLNRFDSPEQHAAIHFETWRLDSSLVLERDIAAAAYRELMARQPNRIARDRYQELTGESLPLPSLGDPLGLRPAEFDLPQMLARIDDLITQIQARLSPK